MDWYLFAKWLHVTFAIVWVGGGVVMVILAMAADRARDDAQLFAMLRQVAWAAEKIYVPASILTLIFGVIASWLGGLFSQLWVILGLLGIATTIAIGIAVLTPRIKKVEADYVAAGNTTTAGVMAGGRAILTIAKFDMVLLFTIVADMVIKPDFSDWAVLLVMVIVLAGAAALFLLPLRSAQGATA